MIVCVFHALYAVYMYRWSKWSIIEKMRSIICIRFYHDIVKMRSSKGREDVRIENDPILIGLRQKIWLQFFYGIWTTMWFFRLPFALFKLFYFFLRVKARQLYKSFFAFFLLHFHNINFSYYFLKRYKICVIKYTIGE